MPFLCGARRKREAGFVARGRLEVSIDVANMAGRQGQVITSRKMPLTQSVSAKREQRSGSASAAGAQAGGRANAATAVRAPNGRFAPKPKAAAPRDKLVAKALRTIRQAMSERDGRCSFQRWARGLPTWSRTSAWKS